MNEYVKKLMDDILNEVTSLQSDLPGETMQEKSDRKLKSLNGIMKKIDAILESDHAGDHELQLLLLKGRVSKSITLIELLGPVAALL